jgi:hypothetical protein
LNRIQAVHVTLVLLLGLAWSPAAAPAQALDAEPGSRIRVLTQDRERGVGTFGGLTGDTLLLRAAEGSGIAAPSADPLRMPLRALRSVQASEGVRPQTGRGALLGFAAGAVPVGSLMYVICAETDDCPRNAVPLLYGSAAGLLGAGIGALIGSRSPRERWRTLWPADAVRER